MTVIPDFLQTVLRDRGMKMAIYGHIYLATTLKLDIAAELQLSSAIASYGDDDDDDDECTVYGNRTYE